ncbi:hypothetical protein [Absidia glauca]|uniref:MIR domain-containing protein n=1 Tax=Absidia glauca TaxID=4829 RepID=A0A163J399_ABSGL|nr:hypothetical protein [Absidia glauca]
MNLNTCLLFFFFLGSDRIELKHVATGRYISTDDNTYHCGSKQQNVFATESPSTWVVLPPKGSGEEKGYEVGWGDEVLLQPLDFPDQRLHSSPDTLSPTTGQQEVSCYDGSDKNDLWKVVQKDEDKGDDFWRVDQRFYLKHTKTKKFLHTHDVRYLKETNEVTAFEEHDENSVFVYSEKASIEVRLGYNHNANDTGTGTPLSAPAIVIAHPYGPLGGNMHNNVVIALQKSLMNKGYTTASFNFRGCGKSTGRTSWTGIPEQKDYQAVIDYLLERSDNDDKGFPAISHLLVCGYSYGSMIAASIRESRVPTSYLLISYPLRVAWALSTTKMSYFRSMLNELMTAPTNNEPHPALLLIFGDQDQFTSMHAYQSWVKTINCDTAKSTVVEGVDHFWMDKEPQLLEHIYTWLSTIPSLSTTQ